MKPEVQAAAQAIIEPLPDDARMNGYYIGFERTGIGAIDAILSAIAHAGKAFHHTEDWNEPWGRDAAVPHGGTTAIEGIQNAAEAAAKAIAHLIDELEADER